MNDVQKEREIKMKIKKTIAVIAAVLLCSCGAKAPETAAPDVQTDAPAAASEEVITTTAEETTAAETTAAETTTEETTAEETTAAKEEATEAEGSSSDEAEEDNDDENTEKASDKSAYDYKSVIPDKNRPRPDKDLEVLKGMSFGTTIDEFKAAMGEPDKEEEESGVITLSYGKNQFSFGNLSDMMKEMVSELTSSLNDDDTQEDDKQDDKQDNDAGDEMRLIGFNIKDDSFNDKLYGGVGIGSSRVDVLNTFCYDDDMDISDELKQELDSDGTSQILYGMDEMMEFLEGQLSGTSEPDGNTLFKMRFGTEAAAYDESLKATIGYMDCEYGSEAGFMFMLSYSYGEDDIISDITCMMMDY